MVFDIEVNNRIIQARKGETILSALLRSGIKVPTLCSMKDFSPTGACRMCVVEVEGKENLIPSCSYPVEEWMRIRTHTPRVLKARKTIVELLLSNHPDDCLYCERNRNCELQKMAEDLNIRERRIPGKKSKYKIDKSSQSILRDPSKCILCGRCVRICEEKQAVSTIDFTRRGSHLLVATPMAKPLNFSNCINCGQCIIVCPTGALTEKLQFPELDQVLYDHKKLVVAQYSYDVSIALAEEFGLKPSADADGIVNAALRKIGFDKVFQTSFAADVGVMEEAEEYIRRREDPASLPMITSDCPSWIKYAEQFRPDLLPLLSKVRSPRQMMGSLLKSEYYLSQELNPSDVYSVSITNCTAGKFEARRVEMTKKGLADIDTVLTSRELARLIRLHGIDMGHLEPEPADEPMSRISASGNLFAVSGGHLEALIRTISYKYNPKQSEGLRLNKLRNYKALKEMNLKIGNRELQVAAVSGMSNAVELLENIRNKRVAYDIIEIMACPGGCVNGGGQPITGDENSVRNRTKSVYDTDSKMMLRLSHKNPDVLKLYEEFLENTGSEKSRGLFYTSYTPKEVI